MATVTHSHSVSLLLLIIQQHGHCKLTLTHSHSYYSLYSSMATVTHSHSFSLLLLIIQQHGHCNSLSLILTLTTNFTFLSSFLSYLFPQTLSHSIILYIYLLCFIYNIFLQIMCWFFSNKPI